MFRINAQIYTILFRYTTYTARIMIDWYIYVFCQSHLLAASPRLHHSLKTYIPYILHVRFDKESLTVPKALSVDEINMDMNCLGGSVRAYGKSGETL